MHVPLSYIVLYICYAHTNVPRSSARTLTSYIQPLEFAFEILPYNYTAWYYHAVACFDPNQACLTQDQLIYICLQNPRLPWSKKAPSTIILLFKIYSRFSIRSRGSLRLSSQMSRLIQVTRQMVLYLNKNLLRNA